MKAPMSDRVRSILNSRSGSEPLLDTLRQCLGNERHKTEACTCSERGEVTTTKEGFVKITIRRAT